MKQRTVLWIGEDGSTLYQFFSKKSLKSWALEAPQPLKPLVEANVLEIVIDTLPQRFMKEPFPKCPWFDRQTVLRQRLEGHFHPEKLWTGKILKSQAFYGLCIPLSPILKEWLALLKEEDWSITSLVSWAAEGTPLFPGTQLVISHTKKGNLRQVFYHQGQALFTRFSKLPAGETAQAVVDRDVQATLDYLERSLRISSKNISLKLFPPFKEKDFLKYYLQKSRPSFPIILKDFKRPWFQSVQESCGPLLKKGGGIVVGGALCWMLYDVSALFQERNKLHQEYSHLQHFLKTYEDKTNSEKDQQLYGLIQSYKVLEKHLQDPLIFLQWVHARITPMIRLSALIWKQEEIPHGSSLVSLQLKVHVANPKLTPAKVYEQFIDFLKRLQQEPGGYQVDVLEAPYNLGENQTLLRDAEARPTDVLSFGTLKISKVLP